MRLIDGEALQKAMYHEAFETDSPMQKWDSGCWIRYKMFENALESAPTIDAVPVKHGEWVKQTIQEEDGYYQLFVCSNCEALSAQERNYCYNCGAKMDGGKRQC